MKLFVLAAGYATRLYPLTLTQPKPLLKVAGRPILDHVLTHFKDMEGLSEVVVISNSKFHTQFQEWEQAAHTKALGMPIRILPDGSTDENQRLGAIGDLHFAIEQTQPDDDIMVVAGDNLFSRSLKDFGLYCRQRKAPVLGVYDVGRLEHAKRYSAVHTTIEGQISSFEEKPEHPNTTLIGIALYYYPKASLGTLQQYLHEGQSADQPGRLIQWLYPREPVYTWNVPGLWYDIGSKETLEEANRVFSNL